MELLDIFISQEKFYSLGYSQEVVYRIIWLNKLYKAIKANEKQLIEALNLDLGNSEFEAYLTEIGMIYKSLKYSIKNLEKWAKDKKVKSPIFMFNSKSIIRSEAYGKVLILNAYNYPLLLSVDPLIGALAAGNTVMLGLDQKSKNVNQVLMKIINTTFESNYVYCFETNRQINNQILNFKFDKIFYTGSSKVGKIILEQASKNLIPTTLELGGKSFAIVSDEADLNLSVERILWGKLLNLGQTCVAVDYVLVKREISELFIKELLSKIKNFDSTNKLINEKSYLRIKELIENDKDYLINEVKYNEMSHQISLAVLKADLLEANNLSSMQEEIFGPILPIIIYDEIEDVVRYTRDTYPLAMYIFTKNKYEANFYIENIKSGGVVVNNTILHLANLNLPFGGINTSGMGHYHGKFSFDTFSQKRSILRSKGNYKLLYPPFSKFKSMLLRLFLR